MKKLLSLLLFVPIISFSQKTQAIQIFKNGTAVKSVGMHLADSSIFLLGLDSLEAIKVLFVELQKSNEMVYKKEDQYRAELKFISDSNRKLLKEVKGVISKK